jgi:Shikimate kinase
MNARNVSITLIGPGGAGKSTVGALIAKRLGMTFVDLDRRFGTRSGDISEYIDRFGYSAYARENVETYNSLAHQGSGQFVAALGKIDWPGSSQSVMPEGNQRIDARCLSRRHVRREKGSRQQRYDSQRQCQRIVGRHAVQE